MTIEILIFFTSEKTANTSQPANLPSRLVGCAKNARSPADLSYSIAQLIIGHLKLPVKANVLKINNIVQTSGLTILGKSL